jgi:hypothetical protein
MLGSWPMTAKALTENREDFCAGKRLLARKTGIASTRTVVQPHVFIGETTDEKMA